MQQLNFNALNRQGPQGFLRGFEQGQDQQMEQQNQLAQQQRTMRSDEQVQQLNAMKMRGIQDDMATKSRGEKAAMFRDGILRASNPNVARDIIKRQYADQDLGPLLAQTLPLEEALLEIPDDIAEFKAYQTREAIGVEKYAQSQMPKVAGNSVYLPSENRFITAPKEPVAAAQPTMVAEFNFARSPDGGGFKGTYQDFVIAREAAKRAPRLGGGGGGNTGSGGGNFGKPPSGYRYTPTGELEAIPGGPAVNKNKDASVSEQQAAYNIGRVLSAANQIKSIGAKSKEAEKPGPMEALSTSLGMEGTANVTRSADRQIVYGAQRDALDALLYLATGAAYNKEQLAGQMAAYIPSFTDKKQAISAKRERLSDLIQSAKIRAGKAWTPDLDAAMRTLMGGPNQQSSGTITKPAAAIAPPPGFTPD